ncbi:MAG: hypothetical protein ACI9MB_001615 [Verrucomicrobiales bacterium]|jgi:hypothetical protein
MSNRTFASAILILAALVVSTPNSDAQKKKKGKKAKSQVQEENKPWWDAPQPRFSTSELGRTFSGTIEMRGDVQIKDRNTYKAIAVRLGEDGAAATALFDTEMMRMACAVPDRPVMFNTYRDGLGGAGHWVGSPYLFTAEVGPGWADANGSFKDPRAGGKAKAGPLPTAWAQYRGLYRNGARTIFSYTVGGVAVLDHPWVAGKNFTRSLEIAAAESSMKLRVCQAAATTEVVIAKGSAQAAVEKKDGHWFLEVPAHTATVRIKLVIGNGSDASKASAPEDLSALTRGGSSQSGVKIVTQGSLGKEKGAYVVDTITPPFDNPQKILFRFGGHDFFSNGDIAACTIDGDVWRVSGIDDKLENITWQRLASGLFQPLGLRVVDDKVYVLGRDQITRLHDFNDDGEADFYECFNNGCKIGKHVHEFATGLETDPDGNFYFVKGHGANNDHAGTLLKISKDGSELGVVATGFRWPNGSGVGPNGEMTVADQQGTWVPSSRLDLVKPGGFYGFMNAHHRETPPTGYDGPLCWIPHSVDNSCGGQTWVAGDKWGPFEGHMLHTSYGKCELFLVMQENIGGVDQAGVYKFPLRFQSGAMRARFNPVDGQLYVSGLKGWQSSAAKDGCLQRVRYTGKAVFMPKSVNVHENGIHVGFTQKLDKELAEDLGSWGIEQWNYKWTKAYGSKEFTVKDPDKIGHDKVEIVSAKLSDDGRSVFLKTKEPLVAVMQMEVHFDLESIGGEELIGDVYNTIHALAPAR